MKELPAALKRGSLLPNGARVIEARAVSIGGYVVLAQWGDEYITWRAEGEGDCYWGHYFRSVTEAARDYEKRIAGYNARAVVN